MAVPAPGDVIHVHPCYPGDSCYTDAYSSGHVGYVYAVDENNVYTIEGNHNPDYVEAVVHERKDCDINGYYRPYY